MDSLQLRQSLRLLFSRRFGTFWFATLLSNIGTWAQQVAQPWLMMTLGASAQLMGLDAFALGAPALLLTLAGGALADRSDRRRIITTFQSIQMLCPIAIVLLLVTGATRPWMIISLSLVVGVTDALSMPSFQSIVPSLVRRDQVVVGLALNSVQFNLSRILGPTLAALLFATVGAIGCFAANAVSYIPFILVALWILPPQSRARHGQHPQDKPLSFSEFPALVHDRAIRGALLTVFIGSLLAAQLVPFCALLVKEALSGNEGDFSLAMGAFGVGGLIGATVLLSMQQGSGRVHASLSAMAHGAVVVLAALNRWTEALPPIFVLAGLSMTLCNISANGVIQSTVNPKVRGAAVSMYMLAMRGGLSIGSLLTGLSIGALGIREALLINGVLAILLQFTIARSWRIGATGTAHRR